MSQPENILQHLDTTWETDVKERISQQLEQRSQIDEIEFGQMLADALSACSGQFVFTQGQFWFFNAENGLYEPVDEAILRNILYEIHDTRGHDRYHHKLTKPKIDRIIKISADKLKDNKFFDDTPQGVATKDGFLLLDNGKVELRNHDAKNRARWKVRARFSPLVTTEETEAQLEGILGDCENVKTFLEILGVTIFGIAHKYSTMLVLVGEGANGKSTVIDIMRKMFPANMCSAVPFGALTSEYLRVELNGKVLNTCEEFPIISKSDVQVLKNIISGGEVQARYVKGNAFTMKPIAQLVISANHLPPMHENNEALRRRLIVIRFNKIIPVEQRDINFAQKFFDEHSDALLLLSTRALEDALKRGRLYEPIASTGEVDRWLNRSDCVGSFLKEHVEQTGNPKDRIPTGEMFEACVRYANEHGLFPPSSQREFGSRLEAIGFSKVKSSSMHWVGVRLRVDNREDREE